MNGISYNVSLKLTQNHTIWSKICHKNLQMVDPLNVNRRSTEIPFPFYLFIYLFIYFYTFLTRSGLPSLVGCGRTRRTPLATGLRNFKNTNLLYHLRANAHKIQSIPGQGQNFDFAHILSIDRHYQMNKRGVVCFSKDRFNLAKIKKSYFYCRRLQNTQNLRQNRLLAKLCLHVKGVEFGENLFQCINL